MRNMTKGLAVGLFSLLASPLLAASLTLCHEDVDAYPWIFGEKDGLDRYVMQTVAKRLGLAVKYRPLPWKRCQFEVKNGMSQGMFSAAFSAERSVYADYPLQPDGQPNRAMRMAQDRYLVYRHMGSNADWRDGEFRHVRLAGIQAGYSIGPELRTMGLTLDERSSSTDDLFRKLDSGAIDVAIVLQGQAAHALQQFPQWTSRLEALPEPYRENDMYLALNKTFCRQNKDLCPRLWQEIRAVRESPEYRQLQQKYGF